MSLQCLPKSTIKLIGSSQVITSVSAAIKELVENSLDAGALSIDVKLENHGMDKIEVRDDGCGVSKEDVVLMCKKSYTSKITSFADLDNLSSYGFRGEALNALCAVSKLTVTTKTDQDSLAYSYYFDSDGSIKESKPSHITKGTIIVAEGLFRNLPVRRQFLTNGRKKSEEIRKVESVVKSLAIVHPRLRLTFTHNKFLIWQKTSVANLKQSLGQAIPPTIISQLDSFNFTDEISKLEMDVLLPKKDGNISVACFSNKDDAFYLFINSRPVKHKELEKVVEGEMVQYFGHYIPNNKYPLCLLSIKLPPDGLDVNLEPNKTKVLIKDLDYLTDKIKSQFLKFYTGLKENVNATTPIDIKLPKRKLDEIPVEENVKIPKIETNVEESFQLNCSGDVFSSQISQRSNNDLSEAEVNIGTDESNKYEEENKVRSNAYETVLKDDIVSNSIEEIVEANSAVREDDNSLVKELDELELILATSTQSSIVVEPDINSSLDCFASDKSSQSSGIVKSDVSEVNACNFSNTTKEENRNDNICEFLSGLPVRNDQNHCNTYTPETTELSRNMEVNNIISDGVKDKAQENNEEDGIDLDNITISQWSKGHVLEPDKAPVTVKPIQPHCSKMDDEDDIIFSNNVNCMEKNTTNANSSQMDRSVSSQMGCKNMSAFTKFAKEMRTKIIQQQPGISFTRVASELASRWRDLDDDEKYQYEELARAEKAKNYEKKTATPEPKLKQTSVKPKPSIEPFKGLKKMKYDNVVEVNTSVADLRSNMNTRCSTEIIHPQILCKLTDDLYCFSSDNTLSVLSALRLNEVINYYKNMSTMTIPLKILENNIHVRPEEVGEENWYKLHSLQTSVDLRNNTIVVANEIITKNGFRIEVCEAINGKQFEITDVPVHVSFYGVEDLKEILQLMDKAGPTAELIDCRPLKIASYIRSETIRTCSSSQLNFESKGWDSMFNFWFKNVRKIYPNCPHHKPVSKDLFKFVSS